MSKFESQGRQGTQSCLLTTFNFEIHAIGIIMSSRRSKSGSRSRGLDSSSSYGPAEDEVKRGGFFPMMVGMTVSLMLLFWIVSFFTPSAGGRKEENTRRSIKASTILMQSSNFEQFLREANVDQIVARLNELKDTDSPKLSPAKVTESNQRIQLCKRLLRKKTSAKLKQFAKLEWMQSEKTKYGIDFLGKMNADNVSEEFEACFTRFLNDTDQEVYREAHLARVSHVLFECIKGKRSAEDVSKYLSDTLKKFPDDDRVASIIRLQFKAAVESDITLAKQLAEDILRKDSLKDEQAASFMQFVLDHYQLIKVNYEEMFVNRFVNGDVGLRELQKTSVQLASNPDAGPLVVEKVSKVASWFERRRQTENARQIYQAMVDASQRNQSIPETKTLLEKVGNAGVKRTGLIGQKIAISGATLAGKQIDKGDFDGRIILAMFFHPNQEDSKVMLEALERSAQRFAGFGFPVRVIAVPSNSQPFEESAPEKFESSRIHYFGWSNGQPPELINAYPVTNFPHLMAIDHNGNVVLSNLDPQRYEQDIEALVDLR